VACTRNLSETAGPFFPKTTIEPAIPETYRFWMDTRLR
jgi:hypothetical protein